MSVHTAGETPDTCVVVPTIREYECVREYVANAREYGHADRLLFVLVTEDFCDADAMRAMLDDLDVAGVVFDESDRHDWYAEHGIGDYDHVVPAASHAQTSFGLLYLWAHDFEFGFFIDDDTLPHGTDFFGGHYRNLSYEGSITQVRSADDEERWVNVLHQNFDEHGLYPRGYPYAAMGGGHESETVDLARGDVVASQGLWTNVPDLDAVRILMDGDLQGQVPAFYQLPMDDNGWDVGRFDDIWSGVFLKRAADVLGKRVLTGTPLCEHNKAPRSTFDDLNNEVPALELNEHVWEVVDDVGGDADTFRGAFAAMADAFADGEFEAWTNGDFLTFVGEHMRDWLDCLDALDAGRPVPSAAAPAVAETGGEADD